MIMALLQHRNITDVPENTRRQGLISTIFKCYRKNFVLFWYIMLPFIALSLLFEFPDIFLSGLPTSESLWHFDTSRGLTVGTDPKRVGVGWGTLFMYSAISVDFLWLAMCPLAFIIVEAKRGLKVALRTVWKQTMHNTGAILALFFLLALPAIIAASILLIFIEVFRKLPVSDNILYVLAMLTLGVFFSAVFYFMINSSLCNQSVVFENLRAMDALRRSSRLVRPTWSRFFRMYVVLAWTTVVLTSVLLAATLLIFSFTVPEFKPVRDMLLSTKGLTLFIGGHIRISFAEAPNFWTVWVMATVNALIHAVIAPIWAILTTHLYLERSGVKPDAIKT